MEEKEKKTAKRTTSKEVSTEKPKKKTVKKETVKEEKEESFVTKLERTFTEEVEPITKEKKNKKTDSKLMGYVIAGLIIACFSVLVGSMVTYYALGANNEKGLVSTFTEDENINKLIRIYNQILDKHYLDLDKGKLIEGAINGMLEMTGDPYTAYLDQDTTADFDERMEGIYYGIGSEIIADVDGNVYFYNVFADSPAANAGIENGDIIRAINGKSVEGLATEEITSLIKGDGKTVKTVSLTYERDGKENTVTLTTALVNIPSVYTNVFERNGKKVGYIQITVFAANTAMQYLTAISDLEAAEVQGLIIDVRNNSGGYLSTVDEMLENTLPKNSVKYQLKSRTTVEKVTVQAGKKIELPMVVLQNGASASGSEMLTVSYLDNYQATIIGATSFGKGTVQGVDRLSDGSMVKYTTKEWLSPNGNSINEVGIEPTIKLDLNLEYYMSGAVEDDNQLQAAIDYLTK